MASCRGTQGTGQRRVLARIVGERHAGHRCIPRVAQGTHARPRPVRMRHDAAARGHDEVVEPRAAKVPGAWRTVCPEENTGMARQGLSGNIGLRHSRAERITLSSFAPG